MDKDKQGSNKFSDVQVLALLSVEICDLECKMSHVDIVYQGIQSLLSELVGMIRIIYKPVLRDHIQQDIVWAFQTGG